MRTYGPNVYNFYVHGNRKLIPFAPQWLAVLRSLLSISYYYQL